MDELEENFAWYEGAFWETIAFCSWMERILDSLYHLAVAWDAYPGFWQRQEDGTLVYGSVTDQMKEALCDWQRWYQEGSFSKGFC